MRPVLRIGEADPLTAEHIVQCGPHRFRIVGGMRVWVSEPPPGNLQEIHNLQRDVAFWRAANSTLASFSNE